MREVEKVLFPMGPKKRKASSMDQVTKPTVQEFVEALQSGSSEVVASLLSRKADPDEMHPDLSMTPRNLAGMLGIFIPSHQLESFIECDEDYSSSDEDPLADIPYACYLDLLDIIVKGESEKEFEEVLQELPFSEIDFQDEANSFTLLMHLSSLARFNTHHSAMIDILLKQRKPSLDLVDSKVGRTALLHAIKTGSPKAALALIEAGADSNKSDHNGITPLMQVLLRISELEADGVGEKFDEVLSALLRLESLDIDAKNKQDGETALHIAAVYNHLEQVDKLVDAGASMTIKDDRGFTAEMLAREEGLNVAADYLKETERSLHLVHCLLEEMEPEEEADMVAFSQEKESVLDLTYRLLKAMALDAGFSTVEDYLKDAEEASSVAHCLLNEVALSRSELYQNSHDVRGCQQEEITSMAAGGSSLKETGLIYLDHYIRVGHANAVATLLQVGIEGVGPNSMLMDGGRLKSPLLIAVECCHHSEKCPQEGLNSSDRYTKQINQEERKRVVSVLLNAGAKMGQCIVSDSSVEPSKALGEGHIKPTRVASRAMSEISKAISEVGIFSVLVDQNSSRCRGSQANNAP